MSKRLLAVRVKNTKPLFRQEIDVKLKNLFETGANTENEKFILNEFGVN